MGQSQGKKLREAIKNNDPLKIVGTINAYSALLAEKEGVLCGISSGANIHATLELAKKEGDSNKTFVCILCDFGERYLSTTLFEQEEKG